MPKAEARRVRFRACIGENRHSNSQLLFDSRPYARYLNRKKFLLTGADLTNLRDSESPRMLLYLSKELNIIAAPTLSIRWLLPYLQQFNDEYPDIRISSSWFKERKIKAFTDWILARINSGGVQPEVAD